MYFSTLPSQRFDDTVATSTSQQYIELPNGREMRDWSLTATTQAIKYRFGKAINVSTAPTGYMYNASAATWTDLSDFPWALSGMTANDRLLIGVQGEKIKALTVNMSGAAINSSLSVLSGYFLDYGSIQSRFEEILTIDGDIPSTLVTARRLVSDGTDSGGATFAQDGTITFGPALREMPAELGGECHNWLELRVSATLSANVSVTGITVLGDYIDLAATATDTGDSRWNRLYYIAAGTGTMTVTGLY